MVGDFRVQRHWDFQEKPEPTSEEDWEAFQEELNKHFIKVQEGPNVLRWGYMSIGAFNIKEAYQIRITSQGAVDDIWKKNMGIQPLAQGCSLCLAGCPREDSRL